jgi:hypothetical protein
MAFGTGLGANENRALRDEGPFERVRGGERQRSPLELPHVTLAPLRPARSLHRVGSSSLARTSFLLFEGRATQCAIFFSVERSSCGGPIRTLGGHKRNVHPFFDGTIFAWRSEVPPPTASNMRRTTRTDLTRPATKSFGREEGELGVCVPPSIGSQLGGAASTDDGVHQQPTTTLRRQPEERRAGRSC